ncbi:GSCOCG00005413001-RA-CDS [Cotesia congregata]|nr:GSCOCG00005413001-RA-CDS [Cotesia congregata]
MKAINAFIIILIILIQRDVNSIIINRHNWDFDDINSLEQLIDAINGDIKTIFKAEGSGKENIVTERIRALMTSMRSYERNWFPKTPYTAQYSKRKDFINFVDKLEHFQVKVNSAKVIYLHGHVKDLEHHFHMVNHFIQVFADKRNNDYFTRPRDVCSLASAYIPLFGILHLTEHKHSTKIHEIYDGLMKIVSSELNLHRKKFTDCDSDFSFRLSLYNYYRRIIVMHIKKYILAAFTSALNSVCTGVIDNEELKHIKHRFVNQAAHYMRATAHTLKHTQHFIIYCDHHIEYIELEKMIQTFIVKESELSVDNICNHNCDIRSMDKNNINFNLGCTNYSDCFKLGNIEFCELSSKSRRYEWFADSNGNIFGDNRNCSGKIVSLESKFQLETVNTCDNCVCTCLAEPQHNEHVTAALSFREQTSDISNNMVVVGIKFVKKDFMIHVQIAEGLILPRQYLNLNEISWVPLENITYDEDKKGYYLLNEDNENSKTRLTLDSDYTHPKIMNLDNLMVPSGYVMTGVRFRFEKETYVPGAIDNRVQLQIRVTPFDFVNQVMGSLDNSRWITTHHPNRKEFVLILPDNPTKAPTNFQDNPMVHPFIKFRASDVKKDAGQSTVPFFSAQKVSTYTSLGGIGLIHFGHYGYGGFFVFKILELDISQYMNVHLAREHKGAVVNKRNVTDDVNHVFEQQTDLTFENSNKV